MDLMMIQKKSNFSKTISDSKSLWSLPWCIGVILIWLHFHMRINEVEI